MFATDSSNLPDNYSRTLRLQTGSSLENRQGGLTKLNSQHQPLSLVQFVPSSVAVEQQHYENLSATNATENPFLAEMQATIASELAAREIAQHQYEQAQAEVAVWQRRRQIALENNCSEQVYRTACCEKACAGRVASLKAAVDSYNVSINVLQNQLAFWKS